MFGGDGRLRRTLPSDVQQVVEAFVAKTAAILGEKLYGIYMYGASVFDDGGPVQDIDCTVILNGALSDGERENILDLHKQLAERYPALGGEVDAYFILLDAASQLGRPQHQLDLTMYDDSWALHCAHVRAGRYETLVGPEPTEIFPAPSWDEITIALEHALSYVKEHLCYPAYCILNLCRIALSYSERDPVKSKWESGLWAIERFPEWEPLIQVALRSFAKKNSEIRDEDRKLLKEQLGDFLVCAEKYIGEVRDK